jgi:LPXTG-motif cell wall-anchored protein
MQILQFFQENLAAILFTIVIAVALGFFYYFTRVARSEYLSRSAGFVAGGQSDEPTLGVIRHVVGAIGGILAIKGYFGEDIVEVLVGIVIGFAVLFMSWNSLDKDALQDKLQGILRHLVTFLGGIGVITGDAVEQQWITIGGIVITGLGILWSLFKKKEQMSVQ